MTCVLTGLIVFTHFGPFLSQNGLWTSEWFSLVLHFRHVDLGSFENLEGEERLFFFNYSLFSLNDMCDKSGDFSVKQNAEMDYFIWLAGPRFIRRNWTRSGRQHAHTTSPGM